MKVKVGQYWRLKLPLSEKHNPVYKIIAIDSENWATCEFKDKKTNRWHCDEIELGDEFVPYYNTPLWKKLEGIE